MYVPPDLDIPVRIMCEPLCSKMKCTAALLSEKNAPLQINVDFII